jgi:hypothetical protein
MNHQFKRKFIKYFILISILGILAVVVSLSMKGIEKQNNLIDFYPTSKLAFGKGISFVEYRDDRKIYSVSIDSFFIERARLGPFAIGPLNIAHLNKVAIDLYLGDNESRSKEKLEDKTTEKNLLSLEKPISDIKKNLPLQIKKVKRIELKDISLNLWENERRIFRISSDSATVDRKTGDIVFTGHATMETDENGKLQSYRIRWDRKTHLFKVMDPYYLIKNGRKTEGKGIETDYLLERISNVASQK